MDVSIVLDRVDRVYRQGDTVKGVVVVKSPKEGSHQGISLRADGTIKLQLSARSVGLFEAFYSSIRPVTLFQRELVVAKAGKLTAGPNEFPFEFVLSPTGSLPLHETYHGVYVNTMYGLKAEVARGALSRSVVKEAEFIIESPPGPTTPLDNVEFHITQQSLDNVPKSVLESLPPFVVSGVLHRSTCPVNEPLSGELVVEASDAEIRSIELQLVRVETVTYAEGTAREATEIQSIQIADGDIPRNVPIPIHMVLPRLYACPTTITSSFKIEFELNLMILFASGFMVTEPFPLVLHRTEGAAL